MAAIGNALDLGISMVGCWVSRLDTSVTFNDGSTLNGLIETDASINPGNSGGLLSNINGDIIGITNAKLVETGVSGIGYAISINNAMTTINTLISKIHQMDRPFENIKDVISTLPQVTITNIFAIVGIDSWVSS